VRFSSPFQLHPLAVLMWSRRLAPRLVVAANDGYLPGRVNFSIRGGEGDLRVLCSVRCPISAASSPTAMPARPAARCQPGTSSVG
jgi:hypothetical protein